jgi:predicted nucleotidyltransferase
MSSPSPDSRVVRDVIDARREELDAVLRRYGAINPRLFGSVARGDAEERSDVDVLVDLLPDDRDSVLLRLSGLTVGLSNVLGRPVDVVVPDLLRTPVSSSALADAVPL